MLVQEKVPKENDTPRLALRVPSVPHRYRGSIDGRSLARDGGAASMRRPYGPDPVSVPVLGCVEGVYWCQFKDFLITSKYKWYIFSVGRIKLHVKCRHYYHIGLNNMINTDSYNRFKELRQHYYIAGRSLLINNLYGPAGINLGYAVELSLKFILIFKGDTEDLYNHDIEKYYQRVVENEYIPQVNVSDDFIKFISERLNTRYPIMIANNLEAHESESRAYAFTIDMLHCYDDFILQLDDEITKIVNDPKISTGFRCCRELTAINGRIFFHCNDHAFMRTEHYLEQLSKFRDDGDDFDQIKAILENKNELWNFQGLIAVRPWGQKPIGTQLRTSLSLKQMKPYLAQNGQLII